MATITTINSTDLITNSRSTINTNFSNLNTDKIETSVIDTDTTLAANSDAKIPSQKAVKAYVDAGGQANASDTVKGIVEEATQAEVDAGTAVGATGARLYVNPSVAPRPKYSTTQVYNVTGSSPTTWTDLDLSSVVGVQQRTVILAVTADAAVTVHFQRKGTSLTYSQTSTTKPRGLTNIQVESGVAGNVMVVTNTSGVVQFSTNGASVTLTINVEAYW